MSEIVVPSSSDSTEKAIDEYYDSTSDNSSDNSSHKGRPWEGAIEWIFFFFLSATCHSLIGYQSCRSASSR